MLFLLAFYVCREIVLRIRFECSAVFKFTKKLTMSENNAHKFLSVVNLLLSLQLFDCIHCLLFTKP